MESCSEVTVVVSCWIRDFCFSFMILEVFIVLSIFWAAFRSALAFGRSQVPGPSPSASSFLSKA